MTAEIGILNKSGIVLASDSASTIGNSKVYNTAKKLFTLDSMHSVGIMIYGNAEFNGIPWEIIITQYKRSIGSSVFSTLEEYAENFIEFIKTASFIRSEQTETEQMLGVFQQIILDLFRSTEEDVNFLISQDTKIDKDVLVNLLRTKMNSNLSQQSETYILDIEKELFLSTYREILKNILDSISRMEGVSDAISEEVQNYIYEIIIRDDVYSSPTGIVIAGYGKKDIFPKLYSYNMFGFVINNLKYSEYKSAQIGNDNGSLRSTILPFAQSDVVNTVVQGVDPQITNYLSSQVNNFDDKGKVIYTSIIRNISDFQYNQFISPLLNMIALLPVEETAIIAETLLNLTSFKRKYTTSVETVGGPIDVLAITPNDGPIWIKRKHYFDIDNNIGYRLRKERANDYNN
ncbi:TPA: hypothetical protein IXT79_001041 [Enterococcus faecium]|uniref:hypothetical protein n=1 Tax=Enterococcus faecium TaxID=1352 RepID=UPI0024154D9C|nr:hypothetical protein [Enterococcus faecium]EKY8185623.1 hypothetical protein [Enterococcus faecium]MDG4567935.1 hypothetical protein [Enterococcus faecium]MDT2315935.1 hypothetical protein [Enterococcus faecium]HAQ5019842.1 hypothetical protein [Enterococcus faecium]